MLQLLAIVVLISTTVTAAYAQDVNNTQEQKPTEEKQGGEYSGFEEAGKQTEGIPNQEANPTPQAPISDINVQQENQTTAADTTTTGVAAEPTSTRSGDACWNRCCHCSSGRCCSLVFQEGQELGGGSSLC
jgi:hypothetical protein